MKLPGFLRPRRLLPLVAILLGAGISLGGGATYVALGVTTTPGFCRSCHIMEPYVDSWAASSHKDVPCVDCHYEPGILETFEGKFKALSQLAKYVTRTQGTKPWAEVSDYSCMRSGCHSDRLLAGQIQFGRIRFDHRDHLVGDRRGMTLRCTSCHSQIVQGDHLTVTTSTCVLCHFKEGETTEPISDCSHCHGPPTETKHLGEFDFQHADYLRRGVECATCHGDVTRGTGEVPRQRCGTCHNKQEHLERYEDVEFLHRHHVTEHSVNCLECHMQIQHGLPTREAHYKGECTDCHSGTHGAASDLYRGTGGRGVSDEPSAMYLARVTCNGCHRPPVADAPAPIAGATHAADPLTCVNCHGTGFTGMADRWQAETKATTDDVRKALEAFHALMDSRKDAPAAKEARKRYEDAAWNLNLVLLDKSGGVHNLGYARRLLERSVLDVAEGWRLLDPSTTPPAVSVGPRAASEQGCTALCHVGVETNPTETLAREQAFGLPFPHATHLLKARLDCRTCHEAEPHGTTKVDPAGCAACHHAQEPKTESCATCHAPVQELRLRVPEGVEQVPMQDLDCADCHVDLAKGHDRKVVQSACMECHEGDEEGAPARRASEDLAAWVASLRGEIDALEGRLPAAPKEVADEVRRDLGALRKAGPWHNLPAAKAELDRLRERLGAGR